MSVESEKSKKPKMNEEKNQISQPGGFVETEADFKEYNDEAGRFRFLYPKNWFVQESIWDTDVRAVIANSPEGYFWLLASYPAGTDPDTTAKSVLDTMKGEYDKLEDFPAKRMIAGRTLHGYEMNFYYLDFINSALVLGFQDQDRTWVIFQQGTDRLKLTGEPVSCEEVFEAITYSFLDSLSNG